MSALVNALFNSGPGWLNDILNLQVVFDADLEDTTAGGAHLVKSSGEDGATTSAVVFGRALFAAGAVIQGFIRVTAPGGRSVSHNGVVARLESSFVVEDDAECKELHEEELDLVPPGVIVGRMDFPFMFQGSVARLLAESYEGDLFSVRHTVTVTVLRPWYTFEVTQGVPVAVQRIFDIPRPADYAVGESGGAEDASVVGAAAAAGGAGSTGGRREASVSVSVNVEDGDGVEGGDSEALEGDDDDVAAAPAAATPPAAAAAAAAVVPAPPAAAPPTAAATGSGKGGDGAAPTGGAGGGSSAMEQQLALYGPQSMVLEDVGEGAVVTVSYDKGCYELCDHLTGNITFQNVAVPVVLVRLAVVKIENCKGEVADTVIFDDAILDARRWKARKQARAIAARQARTRKLSASRALRGSSAPAPAAAVAGAGAGGDAAGVVVVTEEGGAPPSAAAIVPVTDDAAAAAAAGAGAGVAAEGAAAGTAAEEEEAAAAAAAEEEEEEEEDEGEDSWFPTESDMQEDAAGVDPDLPILGDVTLSLDLDFGLLDAITPTIVINFAALDAEPAKVSGKPVRRRASSGSTDDEGVVSSEDNEASVRYFVRVTVYTDFDADSRRWNAKEVVMYRERLYGDAVPRERLFKPSYDKPASKSSGAGAGGSGGAAAAAAAAAAPAAAPARKPSTSTSSVPAAPAGSPSGARAAAGGPAAGAGIRPLDASAATLAGGPAAIASATSTTSGSFAIARKTSGASTTSTPRTPHLPAGAASPNPLVLGGGSSGAAGGAIVLAPLDDDMESAEGGTRGGAPGGASPPLVPAATTGGPAALKRGISASSLPLPAGSPVGGGSSAPPSRKGSNTASLGAAV